MAPVVRHVVANGLRHRLLEWDGGGDTTALLLHGFLDVAWAFHRLGPALARAGFHAVAPDLRGHGGTERVGAGGYYHFMDYLLDVADLIDQLGRRRVALVGHSMGGGIACYYGGAFPDRPWRIVAMESIYVPETPPHTLPRRTAEWVRSVRAARSRKPRVYSSVEAAAERLRQLDPLCPPEEARELAEGSTVPVEGGRAFPHDPLHLTRGPYPFRFETAVAFWSAIRCPVLLVEAELSEPPDDLDARAAAFADARRVVIQGAGHMMMRHQPDEVARVVLEFLAG
jgi:pimeloyl-ACP methyl ester carboxylesterase